MDVGIGERCNSPLSVDTWKVRGSVCNRIGCTSQPGSMAKVIRVLKLMYSPTAIRIRWRTGTAGWDNWWLGNVEVCRRLQWVGDAGSQGSEAQGLAGEDASKSCLHSLC